MAQQALGMMITMLRIVKVYQTVNQKKVKGLQTMRDMWTHTRSRTKKSRSGQK